MHADEVNLMMALAVFVRLFLAGIQIGRVTKPKVSSNFHFFRCKGEWRIN
jgi:hypothetical protein